MTFEKIRMHHRICLIGIIASFINQIDFIFNDDFDGNWQKIGKLIESREFCHNRLKLIYGFLRAHDM